VERVRQPDALVPIAVEQRQQPGSDHCGEALRQLVGAALDPEADRGSAVIF
jgi:hypothetical protein